MLVQTLLLVYEAPVLDELQGHCHCDGLSKLLHAHQPELRGPMTHPLARSGAEELLAGSSEQRPASRSQTSLVVSGLSGPVETEGPPLAVYLC